VRLGLERSGCGWSRLACGRAGWWLVWMVLAACVGGPQAAAASPWAIQTVRMPTVPTGRLSAVSCSLPTSCTAVGSTRDVRGLQVTLALRWDGRRWWIERTPNPSNARGSWLSAITCRPRQDCVAAGGFINRTRHRVALVERWRSSRWSVQRTPAGLDELAGVSCPSLGVCMFVSYSHAAQWNGKRWTVRPSAGALSGVSCWSPKGCMAVGSAGDYGATWAQRWNGHKWSNAKAVDPGGSGSELGSVSCTSSKSCFAVGTAVVDSAGDTRTFGEVWDGKMWTWHDAAYGGQSTSLVDVACTSRNACSAVGSFTNSAGFQRPLAERWNGRFWSVERIGRPKGATEGSFAAVTCVVRGACMSVGTFQRGGMMALLFAGHRRGPRWVNQNLPTVTGPGEGALKDVSCSSRAACTAVGQLTANTNVQVTLAARWNGRGWKVQTTPSPRGATASLDAVSCASDRFCIALGTACGPQTDAQGYCTRRLVGEVWNGVRWTMQTVPGPAGATSTELSDLSCSSPTFCLAVGKFSVGSSGDSAPLAEMWNGSGWTSGRPPSPPGAQSSELAGVSCLSATACITAGKQRLQDSGNELPLAEAWDGGSWTIQTTPSPGGTPYSAHLDAVSCTADASCTAVGAADQATLVERWNGLLWSLQATPSASTTRALTDVSCPSASACLAVGTRQVSEYDNTVDKSLAEVWNGAVWALDLPPMPPGGVSSRLAGVTCPAGGGCVAVGSFSTDAIGSQPLVEWRSVASGISARRGTSQ
jgi:hypothetical protein